MNLEQLLNASARNPNANLPDLSDLKSLNDEAPKTAYKLYGGDVELIFDEGEHAYFVGDVKVPGVTDSVHILDKPALVPWAAKIAVEYLRDNFDPEKAYTVDEFDELLNKAKSAPRDAKEDASVVGSIAHDWIENYIKACIANDFARQEMMLAHRPEDERAANAVNAALDWMYKHNVKWMKTEEKIYSIIHKYAGTADGVCRFSACGDPTCCGEWVFSTDANGNETASLEPLTFKHVICMADWKTSNGLWPEYEYQTALYVQAVNEESAYLDNKHSNPWEPASEQIQYRVLCRLGKEDGEFEAKLLTPDTLEADTNIGLQCLRLAKTIDDKKDQYSTLKARLNKVKKQTREQEKEAQRLAKQAEKDRKIAERVAAKLSKKPRKTKTTIQ